MKFSKFSELVNRILSNNHSHRRDMDVTIVVHSPGRIGSTPSVEVQSIQAGFDWDAGQVMIFPAQPLTTLTPEQVADITESVHKGQSWHAYQEYKKHKEQLEKLSMELEAAKQREKDLFMENVRLMTVTRDINMHNVAPRSLCGGRYQSECLCTSYGQEYCRQPDGSRCPQPAGELDSRVAGGKGPGRNNGKHGGSYRDS